jgi:hypothetical protein
MIKDQTTPARRKQLEAFRHVCDAFSRQLKCFVGPTKTEIAIGLAKVIKDVPDERPIIAAEEMGNLRKKIEAAGWIIDSGMHEVHNTGRRITLYIRKAVQ